jgi:RNA polymerase sigma-70 factor (ECF subfamily)
MRDSVLASDRPKDGMPRAGPADAERMRALVTRYFDFVWRTVRRFGVPPHTAEDAAQKVFLVASNKIGPVPSDRERAFLVAVSLRVAATERRRQRRQHEAETDEDIASLSSNEPSPDELVDRKKARAVMESILDQLPLECRAVLVLYEMEEYTMAEIGELLDLPAGTVASRLRRARQLFESAVTRYKARFSKGDQ